MIRLLLLVVPFLVLSTNAHAKSSGPQIDSHILVRALSDSLTPQPTDRWMVGDFADYNLDGGFITGTMHMFVREKVSQGTWIQQDLDLSLFGKQRVEVLYDSEGRILELLVNGEKQNPPDPNDMEIVETRHDTVTVPKGQFDCMWVKMHSKSQNTDSQVWVNQSVAVSGMVKSIQPNQMGEITIELTDFGRGQ